jgi:uncharacterized membrane protein YjgN (DUF898 family)
MKDIVEGDFPLYQEPVSSVFMPLIWSEAKIGELYKIFIPNVLFTILTLGLFRFWAKVRNRRYILSRVSVLGDSFEYSGTGGELFKGFLIIFFLILLPFGIIPAFYANAIAVAQPEQAEMIRSAQGVFFFLLFPVAIIRSYRYLFSRISWRGVRFAQVGATFGYWWRWVGFMILMPLTFGLIYPKREVVLSRYIVSNTRFGNQAFQMDVKARKLYPAFLLMVLAMAVLFIVFQFAGGLVLGGSLFSGLLISNGSGVSLNESKLTATLITSFVIGAILVAIIGLCLFNFAMAIYKRKVWNEYVSCSYLGECKFKADIGLWEFAQFQFINTFLFFATLGFAYPIIVCRTLAFIARHVEANNIASIEQTLQIDREELKTGEGLADVLDFSAF